MRFALDTERTIRIAPFGLSLVAWLLLTCGVVHCKGEDLTCLKSEIDERGNAITYESVPTWYNALKEEARVALDRRTAKLDEVKSVEQIEEYQRTLKKFFIGQLGGFPERTPLNARITGRLIADGYHIEKVIFESQPNHYVTGNLYVPEGKGPFPGVLISSGHSRTAKTADYNQRYGIAMASNGMIALCFDPIGQGERSQTLNADGKPKIEATTNEHFLVGTGSILVGRNTASYRVWDAMRAIDYLQSRSDVIADRIGMAGCSGGGTLTSYVMALDERVTCAAPSCYLTTFRSLIDTIGPQDAEQNIFGQVTFGLDHPDYVILRAPRPTLISSTTQDYFDIRGAWDNFRQSKRVYARLGAAERVDLIEAEGTHGVQPANLAATAQWMRRWLVGQDVKVPVREFKDFKTFPESELLCTERGQTLLLPGARSVFDLNGDRQKELAVARERNWKKLSREQRVALVQSRTGATLKTETPPSHKAGKVQRDDYHIDKLVIHSGSKVPMPALTFHPKDPDTAAYLYLHDSGKVGDSAPGGEIEALVKQGFVVVSVDLRGQGETAAGAADKSIGDWKTFSLAYLLGHSVVGAHAEDILATANWIANYKSEKPREVHLVAVGRTAVAALHAAALKPNQFKSIKLDSPIKSWSEMAGSIDQSVHLTTTVHGALVDYDLPELTAMSRE